jgi:hypothetical protein
MTVLRRLRLHRIAELGQPIGQPQRCRAGVWGSDQRDFGLVDRRKTTWMVLGEHVAVRDLLGIVPVAFGIYLVMRPAKAPVATEIKPVA